MKGKLTEEQRIKLARIEAITGHTFKKPRHILPAITHPSAAEGKALKYAYERLEFLGDAIMGALVSYIAFQKFPNLDEGGLTRIKVALVSGAHLAKLAESLGFADVIVFGSSEVGTGHRGMHSALENVYEAVVAALYLDGGFEAAASFINATLTPLMSVELARGPENPKSALQEKLQLDKITPSYKLRDTVGPPHDRTFVTDVCAGDIPIARGLGRTKKESESLAARTALERLDEVIDALREAVAAQKEADAAAAAAKAAALEAGGVAVRPCDIQWGLGWHLRPEDLAPGFVWQFQLGEATAAEPEGTDEADWGVPLVDQVPVALSKPDPLLPILALLCEEVLAPREGAAEGGKALAAPAADAAARDGEEAPAAPKAPGPGASPAPEDERPM